MIDFVWWLVGVFVFVGSFGFGIDVVIVFKVFVGGGEVWKFVLCALFRRGSTVAIIILARFELFLRVFVWVFGRKGYYVFF